MEKTLPEGARTDVEIWTDVQRIQGKVFVRSDMRLSDCLNDPLRFMSMTDVKIRPLSANDLLWEGSYLAVNKNSVKVLRLLGDHDDEEPSFAVE